MRSDPIASRCEFLVMELLNGETLDSLHSLSRYARGGVFSGIPNAAPYFKLARKLARALLSVHRLQVIHGDLWTKNIMICSGTRALSF